MFIFERETESGGVGAEREGDTESKGGSRRCQHRAQHGA